MKGLLMILTILVQIVLLRGAAHDVNQISSDIKIDIDTEVSLEGPRMIASN